MKCYICDTEFEDEAGKCPRCGTVYEVDLDGLVDHRGKAARSTKETFLDPIDSVRVVNNFERAAQLIAEGNEQARLGRFSDAARAFGHAAECDPGNPECFFLWGSALFKTEQFLGAEEKWRKAVELRPLESRYANWLKRVQEILNEDF